MKEILDRIRRNKVALLDHPAFAQLDHVTAPQVKEMLRIWSPLLIHLAMTFRDVNRLYYRYEKPDGKLQRVINEHVDVDSEHWRMMVSDIKTLGVNGRVSDCESAVGLIWDDFGSPVRKYIYSQVARARRCGECAILKVASMESAEATSKVFFTTSTRLAAIYEADTGNRLRYLGAEHINSELDHTIDMSVFLECELPEEKRADAISIVEDHFASFRTFLDYKYLVNEIALNGGKVNAAPRFTEVGTIGQQV